MKKFLLFYLMLSSLSAYATCPIDVSGESVCSISNFNSNTLPIFQSPNSGKNLNNSSIGIQQQMPQNTLNKNLYNQSDSIMQYNSGCQFGICVQDLNNSKVNNQ